MPGRAMAYKFLNTFIDDLFAFTIKMPFLHRLATLRDDVIFFVYLYLTKYDYVSALWSRPLGYLMMAGAALILGVGAFWMSRIIKVEV